jgi:hypothetical protein
MKWFLLCALFWPLFGQASFTIVSVDHQGLPPYDSDSRVYRLNAGTNRGLKVGEWLAVRHAGDQRPLGHLQVVALRAEEAGASFIPSNDAWPMKGDVVVRDPLPGLPEAATISEPPSVWPAAPLPGALAPPREGVIFFLPQRADLSPAGRSKVVAWVQSWGVAGKWLIQIPVSRALKPALQKQRADTLLLALHACGVATVEVDQQPRTQEGPYDPSWIRHWD